MENSILIVEEDDAWRAALRGWAEDVLPRYRVIEAANAEEALSLARDHRPGVVLIDMGWFGRDRIQTIRRIKATVPTTEIVALTSHDLEAYREDLISAGASACVLVAKISTELRPVIEGLLPTESQEIAAPSNR